MMIKKSIWVLGIASLLSQKSIAQDKLYENTFSLSDVKLLDGPFKHAQDLNKKILLEYDLDRLLAPFQKEAGLTPSGESFENWIGLDGHVGGHYLTALAIHYASTGDKEIKQRMDHMLAELKKCQDKHGNGYVGGIPNGEMLWQELEKGNVGIVWRYWVPWYNLHKTYAGLRDAWLYAGNEEAKNMFLRLCDWGIDLINHLDDKQMESMLANEFGGMNEVYADAYQIANEEKYLNAARRFAHHEIFDSMAKRVDNLDNKHANTQVPKAVGYQRVAELTNDPEYVTAATYFWETVVNNRSLALGGNSRREHFPSEQDFLNYMEEREGPESCNTNNMMKLTEGLFRMDRDVKYIDFFEKAMYNHILSTQHPEHGGYVYFTSARPSHYRVYSKVNSAMWCCVGTGMENHGKYGEMIYSHANDSLFVNLFVASELNWKEEGVKLTQQTTFPEQGLTTLSVNTKKSKKFKILLRYPSWVPAGEMKILVNGKEFSHEAVPSSYIAIDRKWKNGDKVELIFPMEVRLEELENNPEYVAIFRGPILMGAKTSTENLDGLVAGDHRWGHVASGALVSLFDTPILIGDRASIKQKLSQMQPVEGQEQHFTVSNLFNDEKFSNIELQPFYKIHDSRYMMYWLAVTQDDYQKMLREKKAEEQAALALDKRTVDAIKVGEQQPEVDHSMVENNTQKGNHNGVSFREVKDGGTLSFVLQTEGKKDLELMLQYWGYESGNRTFDILIDDQVLATESLGNKWQQSRFFDVSYPFPASFVEGKSEVTLKFVPKKGNNAGRIFSIRLAEKE